MKTFLRWTITLLVGFAAIGCDEYDPWLVAPEPAAVIGTWAGVLGPPGSSSVLRVTWVATPSSTGYSGPLTLVRPGPNVPATGTLIATLHGRVVSFVYVVRAGSVYGFPGCSIFGQGQANLTGSTLAGALPLTFTSCDGTTSGLQAPTPELSMTKQAVD